VAKERRPDDKESALWKAVTADVRPIDRKAATEAPAKPDPAEKTTTKNPAARPRATTPSVSRPELSHGIAAGVDRRTLDRLRRGQMEIEADLDLHGHTQESAHRALAAFIRGHAGAGRRCVIVVTGKGRDGGGVLRAEVPRWLNEPDLRQHILAFSHARPADGGDGALYVLLRRKRPPAPRKS
jgi:DNA-nicking Smr family endonuclease